MLQRWSKWQLILIVEDDVYPDMFITDSRNVFIGEAPLLIDIMNKLARVEFNEAFPNRTVVVLDNVPVNCIGLDDLRKAKQAAARPKDLEDLKHLQKISDSIQNEKKKE